MKTPHISTTCYASHATFIILEKLVAALQFVSSFKYKSCNNKLPLSRRLGRFLGGLLCNIPLKFNIKFTDSSRRFIICPFYLFLDPDSLPTAFDFFLSFWFPFFTPFPPFSAGFEMHMRMSIFTALCAIILAFYYWPEYKSPTLFNVRGRNNNTVLFVIPDPHGFCNVHLATVQSLMVRYPSVQIHIASFQSLAGKAAAISSATKARRPLAKDVIFHPLNGRSYNDAIMQELKLIGLGIQDDGSPGQSGKPGIEGLDKLTKAMEYAFSPWTPKEHLAIHDHIASIIEEVDPTTIVLDTMFSPAVEATRGKNRSHIIITPNTLVDTFFALQPYGKMFWKYPA